MLETKEIRRLFPILNRKVNNQPLIYFDNGATTQKPKKVIDSINKYFYGNQESPIPCSIDDCLETMKLMNNALLSDIKNGSN